MILIVEAVAGLLLDEVEHVRDGREDLVGAQYVAVGGIALDGALVRVVHVDAEVLTQLAGALTEQLVELVQLLAQLAVDLVATDARQVVALGIEERVLEVGARRLERRRLTRAGALVDLDESLVLRGGDVALLVPLTLEEIEVGHEAVDETGRVILVVAERAQQREHAHAALAGHAGAGGDVLAGLLLDVELEPLTALRVDGALHQLVLGQVTKAVTLTGLEDDAGAAHQLRHHDALGAVVNEGALLGHHGEVAHEFLGLTDLTGRLVHEGGLHQDRLHVGVALFAALLDGVLGLGEQVLVVGVVLELETQVAVEVGDRRDVAERLGQTDLQEVFEALALDVDEVGSDEVDQLLATGLGVLHDFFELGEILVEVGEGITLAGVGT